MLDKQNFAVLTEEMLWKCPSTYGSLQIMYLVRDLVIYIYIDQN